MTEARQSHVCASQVSSKPKPHSDRAKVAAVIPTIRPCMDFLPNIDRFDTF